MKNMDNVWFLCIGTDRSTGDAFGPLVGSRLLELGYNVVGTLEETANATNLQEKFSLIPKNAYVVAIDACLGSVSSVGNVKLCEYPCRPGAGVGKELGSYGDAHIQGVVNVGGFMEYFVLQNTRLALVMKMVGECVQLVQEKFPLKEGVCAV